MLILPVFLLLFKGAFPDSRISGGDVAKPGQFPYQVSLRNENFKHYCGGLIISDYVVLTAALCIHKRNPNEISVVAGTNSLAPSGTVFMVRFTAHPRGFSPDNLRHNIGVVKTTGRILDAAGTAVVALNKRSYPHPNEFCVLTGWGKGCPSDNWFPKYLRYVYMGVISISDCQRAFPDQDIDSTVLCAFRKGSGGCDGDNGNPFVKNGVQYGVLSWGVPGATYKPDVFTNVAAYADFISEYI